MTGEAVWFSVGLVRPAILRRVYTNTHLEYEAEVTEEPYAGRTRI